MTMTPTPAATPIVFVTFSAEVNPTSTVALLNVASNCATQGIQEVHLLLSTPGGSVMHGINLYNVLKGMPYTLVTHNVGNVDSIGTAIFLSGDRRLACAHSTFMFHGVAYGGGNEVFDIKKASERLASLKADQKRVGQIVLDETSVTQRDLDGFNRTQKTLTATEAQARGIVQSIEDVSIPTGAHVTTVVVS